MGNSPHLPKAPILEALIDLQFIPSVADADELSKSEELKQLVTAQYPKVSERNIWQTELRFNGGNSPAFQAANKKRVRLDSTDTFGVVQFNNLSLTCSRLKPYTSWDVFSAEFYEVFEKYVGVFKPTAISNIGVRFINRFSFSSPLNLAEHFQTAPVLGQSTNLAFGPFSLQFNVRDEHTKSECLVTQVAHPEPNSDKIGVIFDINAFKQGSFTASKEQCKKELEDLRELKNRIFFGSVTDKLLKEFT